MQRTSDDRTLNPFPWYRQMRETDPIHFYPEYRAWQVFRYDDVLRVLSDSAVFSSSLGGGQDRQDPLAASLVTTDPPRHRQLRNLVTQAFTPRSVAGLTDRITAIVNDLLDRVAAQGQMDVVDDLAYPLPVIVIAEM